MKILLRSSARARINTKLAAFTLLGVKIVMITALFTKFCGSPSSYAGHLAK